MAKYYNKQDLVKILQNKADALGRMPQPEDLDNASVQAVLSYFKKWNKALKTVKPAAVSNHLQAAHNSKKKNHPKPAKKIEKTVSEKKPEPEKNTKQDAVSHGRRRYSKSIITQMLLDEFNRLGKKPTRKEIDENKNLPTVATCLNYFDTTRIGDVWNEILK